jgi:hypothetical protein
LDDEVMGLPYLPREKILATGDLFVNGNPWGNNVADVHADYEKWLEGRRFPLKRCNRF